MFTIDELATFRSSRRSRRKSGITLPAKSRTSASPPGSTWPMRAKIEPWRSVEGKAELTKLVNGVEQLSPSGFLGSSEARSR